VLAPLACGITYSPGDFLAPTDPTNAGGPDASDTDTSTTPASDATTPGAGDAGFVGIHIVLVGGHRDALPGESGGADVAETMHTTFSSLGQLGPWSFDSPPPVATAWTHAEIAGGSLFVHNAGTFARAPFANGVSGAWSTAAIKTSPQLPSLKPWLLHEQGFLSGPPLGGISKTTYALPFVDGGLGDWTAKTPLPSERAEVTLARAGDLVYAIGGRKLLAITQGEATVEVAKLDANGDLGVFTTLGKLGAETTPGSATESPTYAPIVATGPGRIVVLGGTATINGAATDTALAATITDPATGALGAWRTLPKLPAAMTGCAVVVTTNHILVFGGLRSTGTTDAILDLVLQSDGSYGTEWKQIGTLPGARSGIVAVTY